tara:strand:- start:217 stop:645 length:429 start_codon:yes stop_codon:yes gene_type:complete
MKINLKNSVKINAALDSVNGRSASFCYTSASELRALVARAESVLSQRGVFKRNFPGAVLSARQDGPYASRYKYPANATLVKMQRTSGGWFLVSAQMSSVLPCEKELFHLAVSPDAGCDVARYAMRDMSVREPDTPRKGSDHV